VAPLVGFLVEAERVFPIGQIGDNSFGAALCKPATQRRAVVSPVPEQLSRRLGSADEAFGYGTIMRLAVGQEDGKKTAFSICDCVELRITPAALASNRLLLLPPFPPDAERCALICVESIICVCVVRP
jgi:hypothetical protein